MTYGTQGVRAGDLHPGRHLHYCGGGVEGQSVGGRQGEGKVLGGVRESVTPPELEQYPAEQLSPGVPG